jgi:uncharacterized membrane protein
MVPVRRLLDTRAGRTIGGVLLAIAACTAVGLVVLWPGDTEPLELQGLVGDSQTAEVVGVQQSGCPTAPEEQCTTIDVSLADATAGLPDPAPIDLGSSAYSPQIDVGDRVRVAVYPGPPGQGPTVSLVDFERRTPMLWLAIAFAALVIVFGRLRGGLSLIGLLGSLTVVFVFIVPAILAGSEPIAVAIIGGLAVMLVTISLAHGLGIKSAAAMLGTAASLVLVALLALGCTELLHLTGFNSEETALLASQSEGNLSVEGLLLAGMVIGALGVLDDVTVSQASTVLALRSADPRLPARELYSRAIDVGRDHISATVNTLVLAYVGASLPVLLAFSAAEVGFSDVVNSEIVASEIVAMLVGSIGLIAAVPLTTALAAALVVRMPREAIDSEASAGHVHAH